jgi:peptidoglycan/LPS O-acetylase OafA/YrhL
MMTSSGPGAIFHGHFERSPQQTMPVAGPVAAPRPLLTSLVARSGNFDAIRLIAASAVIFGHSFIVVFGKDGRGFLGQQADSLAVCAVETFFIISGYLVTQSFERSSSWRRFVLARSLRIFPGLVACVLFSALILGPIFTKLPLSQYFASGSLWGFISYNSLLDDYSFPYLPAVAFHAYKQGKTINGSLWSLPWEFMCYSIVFILGVVRRLNGRTASFLLGLTLLSLTFRVLNHYAWFLSYFAAGMCLFFFRKRYRLNGYIACLAGVFAVSGNYGLIPWGFVPVLGAYFIIYVAVDAPFKIANATRFGDLSYGIYLYGWPCEEVAAHLLGGVPRWWQIFVLALPSAALLAWLSWHAVERRALRWKNADLSGLRQRIGAVAMVAYSSTAILVGIRFKIFSQGCVLPAALALGGVQILSWARAGWPKARSWFWFGNLPGTQGEAGHEIRLHGGSAGQPDSAAVVAVKSGYSEAREM